MKIEKLWCVYYWIHDSKNKWLINEIKVEDEIVISNNNKYFTAEQEAIAECDRLNAALEEKHSPLPWHLSQENLIFDANHNELWRNNKEFVNKRLIVKAVNNHYKLIEALENVLRIMGVYSKQCDFAFEDKSIVKAKSVLDEVKK